MTAGNKLSNIFPSSPVSFPLVMLPDLRLGQILVLSVLSVTARLAACLPSLYAVKIFPVKNASLLSL